ncbi:S-methyl-5-thioribose-1-phosphate isomerase, partial [bacterium]|nr:S-methyl-5-thioribose-1-phosphate isomerase [bacterium]
MNVLLDGKRRHLRPVTFDSSRNEVLLIEQRLLPLELRIHATRDYTQTAEAIKSMVVRGAGAIGATAAYGLAQGARSFRGRDEARFLAHLDRVYKTLAQARPTAVDPVNAMNAILAQLRACQGSPVAEYQAMALAAAEEFAHED